MRLGLIMSQMNQSPEKEILWRAGPQMPAAQKILTEIREPAHGKSVCNVVDSKLTICRDGDFAGPLLALANFARENPFQLNLVLHGYAFRTRAEFAAESNPPDLNSAG